MRALDLAGTTIGRLSVLRRDTKTPSGNWQWLCVCSCGTFCVVAGGHLRNGQQSCGCLIAEARAATHTKHGLSRTKEYHTWRHMHDRCYNVGEERWRDYGGRGITVCERWFSFENFYADMGVCPEGYVIDRSDNEGNYEPNNCKWVTRAVSGNNRRNSTRYFGRSTADIAKHLGVTRDVMKSRFQRNPELWVDIYD